MKRIFAIALILTFAASAQAAERIDGPLLSPGQITYSLPNLAETSTFTLTIHNGVTLRTIRDELSPTTHTISAFVKDTPATFTVTLYDSEGTTIAGPRVVTTQYPEDYFLKSAADAAAFRAFLAASHGAIRYDAAAKAELTAAQQAIVDMRVRWILKKMELRRIKLMRDRAQAAVNTLNAAGAEE